MVPWNSAAAALTAALQGLLVVDGAGRAMTPDDGFAAWQQLTAQVRDRHGCIFLIGNGASASLASHFSADLTKNAQVHTQAFTNVSLLTAVSNDISYLEVYAVPLQHCGHAGDLLVAISSSGKSPNILRAVAMAKTLGMTTVTLSGMSQDNPLKAAGDLNFYLPAATYNLAETGHAAVLHHWMDSVEVKSGRWG
jgi:D-sedoheptulose 7-phosphate isomerase